MLDPGGRGNYAATITIEIPQDKIAPLVAALKVKYPALEWNTPTGKVASTKTVLVNFLKQVELDYRKDSEIRAAISASITNTMDEGIAQ